MKECVVSFRLKNNTNRIVRCMVADHISGAAIPILVIGMDNGHRFDGRRSDEIVGIEIIFLFP